MSTRMLFGTTADGRKYWTIVPIDLSQRLWVMFHIASAALAYDAEHGCKTVRMELEPLDR